VSRLFVTVSGLEKAARSAASATVDLKARIGDIDDLVATVEDSFEGKAATEYQRKVDEWVTEALSLVTSAEGLGKFLGAAAKAVQEVDTKLAEALQGSGASDQITASGEFLRSLSTRTANIAAELEAAEDMFSSEGFQSSKISGALKDFRKGWSDARKAMIESLNAAKEMTASAADVYQETDVELEKALHG
jgi:uncharacterized protein YukE